MAFLAGCAPSLAPRVEEGTLPVGVIHEENFHASRPSHTTMVFGNPPPHLRLAVSATELEDYGNFALDFDWEDGPGGTITLRGIVHDIVDASEISKDGRASTIAFTVARQDATTRLIPAEFVVVGWPDRGRTYRLYGKPLLYAIKKDRVGDLATLKARFRTAIERELSGAQLAETSVGFDVAYGPRKTTVNLENLVPATATGGAGLVLGRIATSTADRIKRPVAEGETVNQQADAVMLTLGPEALFSAIPQAEREQLISETVAPGVVAVYITDYPDHFDPLKTENLSSIGIDRKNVPELARRNLLESSGKIYRVHLGKGVYLISSASSFDASWLVVPEIWKEIDPVLVGERVVATPDRDTILVTGSNNTQGLEMMRQFLRSAGPSESPVVRHLLVWRGGQWVHSPG